jgi:hypothetical protein
MEDYLFSDEIQVILVEDDLIIDILPKIFHLTMNNLISANLPIFEYYLNVIINKVLLQIFNC